MDKNTITGLILIFAILIGYSIWISPSKEEQQRQQEIRDSIAQVEQKRALEEQARIAMLEAQSPAQDQQKPVIDSALKHSELVSKLGAFAHAAQGEDKAITVETDLLSLQFDYKGGRIAQVDLKDYQSYDSLPLTLFTSDSSQFSFSFFSENRTIKTGELYFEPVWYDQKYKDLEKISITGNEELHFAMRMYPEGQNNKESYIEYDYVLKGDSYMLDFDVRFIKMDKYIARNMSYLNLDWNAMLNRQDRQLRNQGNGATIYYKFDKDDTQSLSERDEEDEESINTKLKWVAFKQRFFSTVLIADNAFDNAELKVTDNQLDNEEREGRYLKTMSAQFGIPYNADPNYEIPMQFYFGPNKFKILKSFDNDLEDLIPLGWAILGWINRYAVLTVFNFLEGFNLNYGIIILILTVLLKLVLFPIAYKTYSSQAKMRVLKPEIDELGKKFPKKEDSMKKQQATMSLYKKAGVNPAAGCVPMLLQFPILIAMFRFFPASIELRQQSFLWATDLSTYDSIYNLPFSIPYYGDHVSLFTLLMTASTILYTHMNSQMMAGSSQQMPGMKTMMYMMPVMMLFFLNNYASALSYYYLLANLITFGQMYLIKRTIDEDKIRKKIAMNKKKPAKKSKWQERMESMAKTQQQQTKKRK